MLLYIYTGNTPNLNKLAGDLLGAAEQYQLEMLKNICEEKLCSSLEISNSVNHLILGDLYQQPAGLSPPPEEESRLGEGRLEARRGSPL